jgi:maltose alpha-D-glucosyltransferase/alpha-amylase
MLDLWYKNAVLYCLDVDTYVDSNGDGVGDFAGLTSKVDYLAGIGVTCIWLLPFYPSPDRDNGYDIVDYYNVAPRLGTLGDFVDFTHQAGQRGMRVIVDLVINHTSDQHPWFQAARKDPASPYRDYYIWSDKKPKDAHKGVIFPGVQESVWTYDRQARAYYYHRFYEHQPDVNVANPAVREEIEKVMGFWLQLGVSGFRIDAAPFVIELTDARAAEGASAFGYLTDLRNFLSWRRGDAIMLAEANVEPKEIQHYFGDDNRMHMLFNFFLNQRVVLALAQQRGTAIGQAFTSMPRIPSNAQWANFLRNHDEIDLGRLSDEERQTAFAELGPEKEMQLYDRGIRRRLASMLGGDVRRLAMAYSLMFSLPGTPVLWYGDEIGMGDDLSLPERNSVRTPMQWSGEPNGGFSTASPDALIRPVIADGGYGYPHVNVAAQRSDPSSLLNVVERLIRTRKECPEIGWGTWHILEAEDPRVFAHCCEWRGGAILAIHNLSSEPAVAKLNLSEYQAEHLVDLLGDREASPIEDGEFTARLDGYAYRWYRLSGTRR